jgi:hypothetical protein
MVNVISFKVGETYQVEYSTSDGSFGDVIRITTGEEPQSDLFHAIHGVVDAALAYFECANIGVMFRSVSVSAGKEPKSRLELDVGLHNTDKAGRLSLPPIERAHVEDWIVDGQRRDPVDAPQNRYNAALDTLLQEVEEYINGKRQQMSLDFEEDRTLSLDPDNPQGQRETHEVYNALRKRAGVSHERAAADRPWRPEDLQRKDGGINAEALGDFLSGKDKPQSKGARA